MKDICISRWICVKNLKAIRRWFNHLKMRMTSAAVMVSGWSSGRVSLVRNTIFEHHLHSLAIPQPYMRTADVCLCSHNRSASNSTWRAHFQSHTPSTRPNTRTQICVLQVREYRYNKKPPTKLHCIGRQYKVSHIRAILCTRNTAARS